MGDPSLRAVTTTPSIAPSSPDVTSPVSATPDCACSGDGASDAAYTTSAATPAAATSNRLFRMTASRALPLFLLFLQERERMRDALVRVGSGDVVRVASNDDEPRIRNLYLVGPRLLHRIHLAAVRGDHQRGRLDTLQDALLREIEVRQRLAETLDAFSI